MRWHLRQRWESIMLHGKSLTAFAAEIERRANVSRDLVAPVRQLRVETTPDGTAAMGVNAHGVFPINQLAHRQLGTYLGVPAGFYDTLHDARGELKASSGQSVYAETMNALLGQHAAEKRMVRTLDGSVRALLSDRYRPIDNLEVAERLLPLLGDMPSISWPDSSLEVTDTKMYMKIVNPAASAVVVPGTHNRMEQVIQAGCIITNSEVGAGSFSVQPFVFSQICSNGLVVQQFGKRRNHVGATSFREVDGSVTDYLRDDTIQARNDATIKEMRDVVRMALDPAQFETIAETLRESTRVKIEGDPEIVLDHVVERVGLRTTERASVLRHLIAGGDLSLWGLTNAVTAMAHLDTTDYDRSTELEAAGGRLLAMAPAETRRLLNGTK